MTETKYIALVNTAKEAIWIRRIINKIGLKAKNIIFHGNNEISINLTKYAESQYKIYSTLLYLRASQQKRAHHEIDLK